MIEQSNKYQYVKYVFQNIYLALIYWRCIGILRCLAVMC